MQADAIAPGQTVVIVDDIIATGAHHRLLVSREVTRNNYADSFRPAGML